LACHGIDPDWRDLGLELGSAPWSRASHEGGGEMLMKKYSNEMQKSGFV